MRCLFRWISTESGLAFRIETTTKRVDVRGDDLTGCSRDSREKAAGCSFTDRGKNGAAFLSYDLCAV